jgi:hypothetical protein
MARNYRPIRLPFAEENSCEDSGGSVAVFEFDVPPERRCPSPTVTTPTRRPSTASKASFTLEGRKIEVGPGDARSARGSGPPLRQLSLGHLKNAGNRHPRHPRSGLLPRNRRHRQSRSRWPTRPKSTRQSHAPPRPHPGSLTGKTIMG